MKRRTFIAMLTGGIVVAPFAAEARQAAAKIARIGYLAANLTANRQLHEAFRQGLRDLGYVQDSNVVIDYRDAEGKLEQLPALATELIAPKVALIMATVTLDAQAAKQATKTIPIIFRVADY